jgi:hypothetical protein
MNHAIKYLLMIWFVVLWSMVSAQTPGLFSTNLNVTSNNLDGKLTGEIYYLTSKASSSFFLQNDWTDGSVTLKTGEVFEGIKMRYLAYGDELIVYNENNRMLVKTDKQKVKEFALKTEIGDEGKLTVFINLDSVATVFTHDFFEVVYRGSVMVLISNIIVAKKVTPYNNSRGELTDTDYVLRRTGFMFTQENRLEKIRFSNNSVAAFFPEKKHEIRKYLRKSNLRITKTNPSPAIFEMLDREGFLN